MHLSIHCGIIDIVNYGSNFTSVDRWMNKADVYVYNRILLSHKNNKTMTFETTCIDQDCMWNKSFGEKQILCDITYVKNLKKKILQIEKQKKKIETVIEKKNKLVVAREEIRGKANRWS